MRPSKIEVDRDSFLDAKTRVLCAIAGIKYLYEHGGRFDAINLLADLADLEKAHAALDHAFYGRDLPTPRPEVV